MHAVDLFAGAGGFSTGAELAGVRVVAAINHWPIAVATHAANHPHVHHRCQDAALMDPRDLPAHELLLASPACTGHTRARGVERPHHDASRATAWCVVNTVEVTRPRFLIVENVVDFQRWELFELWSESLRRLGYRLQFMTLDAAMFGVPQSRVRLFIVGSRDTNPKVQFKSRAETSARTILDLDKGPWSLIRDKCDRTQRRWEIARQLHGSDFLLAYYSSASADAGRSLDRPLGTVTTKDRYALVRGDKLRMLSVSELRRAMGFRDGYILTGTRHEQVKQLGNAVCPPVAQRLVRAVLEAA